MLRFTHTICVLVKEYLFGDVPFGTIELPLYSKITHALSANESDKWLSRLFVAGKHLPKRQKGEKPCDYPRDNEELVNAIIAGDTRRVKIAVEKHAGLLDVE